MSNKKKQGCLWWVCVCLWWVYIGWWWRPLKWFVLKLLRNTENAPRTTTRPTPTQILVSNVERHRVAGTSYCVIDIQSLGVENSDYYKNQHELVDDGLVGERIWRLDFFPKVTTLVPEPDNPHDPNAIKVVVDGVHIGYIKAGSCAHIHKAIREKRIERIKCEIKGGKYKIIEEDCDEYGNSVYTVDGDDVPFYADLYITLK